MSILNPLFEAVAWVLTQIHAGLAVPFGASSGWAWGLSIVILVMLMRLIMVPLFIKQVKSQRKMQAHMPQLREIQKRYKNDKQRQQEEMMKFYKENGINPLGGCLPLVAQFPVFWSLFYVLRSIAEWVPGHPTSYGLSKTVVRSALQARIFGAGLADKILFTGTLHVPTHSKVVILVAVAISASTTFLTMRQSQKRGMMQQPMADPSNPAANMSKYMMYIAPFFALTGLYWQFGLVIYWVTTNVWTLGQQHILFRNLPPVDSVTADSSAAPAVPAASAKVSKTGSAARPGSAKAGSARAGNAAKSGAAAKSGNAGRPGGTKPAAARAGATGRTSASGKTSGSGSAGAAGKTSVAGKAVPGKAVPAKAVPAKAVPGKTTGSRAAGSNGSSAESASSSGARSLLRLGKSKEPEPEPAVPETRIVRQQTARQSRSKRSGKR